jgi:hypothetical protein
MDQDAFRRTYRDVNDRPCVYEKSLLTNQCDCSQAERFCIAEREAVHCRSDIGQAQCIEWLELVRENARFALRSDQEPHSLPHAKAMRVQVGGLRGVHRALDPGAPPPRPIPEVFGLLNRARELYAGLRNIPFQQVIKEVAAYRGRPRLSGRRDR